MVSNLGGGSDDAITDINITPFVDIILVVLIIFMVTASYIVAPSIKVNLPEASTGESTDSSSLGLTLNAEGILYLNGEETTEDALRAFIQHEQTQVEEITALIAADATVSHGRVVWLIDLVKQEGIAKFAINIDPAQVEAYSTPSGD